MSVDPWITQLRKGVADYIVLQILRDREAYGYEILQLLSQVKCLMLGESTLYPLLSRLARDEFLSVSVVKSPAGPVRRYYRLTSSGRKRLQEMDVYWNELIGAIRGIKGGNII